MSTVVRVDRVVLVAVVGFVSDVFGHVVDRFPFHVVGVTAWSFDLIQVVDVFPVLPQAGAIAVVDVWGLPVLLSVLGPMFVVGVLPGIRLGGFQRLTISVSLVF